MRPDSFCYAKNVKFRAVDNLSGTVKLLTIFYTLHSARVEIYDCQFKNEAYGHPDNDCINSMFYLSSDSATPPSILQIRNSQSVQLVSNGYTCTYFEIYCNCNSNSVEISIDDCIFWLENTVSGDFVLFEKSNNTVPTNLVSRSIHNYYDTYNTSWTFTTGIDESLSTLGFAGFGLLENYSAGNKGGGGVQRPFIW